MLAITSATGRRGGRFKTERKIFPLFGLSAAPVGGGDLFQRQNNVFIDITNNKICRHPGPPWVQSLIALYPIAQSMRTRLKPLPGTLS